MHIGTPRARAFVSSYQDRFMYQLNLQYKRFALCYSTYYSIHATMLHSSIMLCVVIL